MESRVCTCHPQCGPCSARRALNAVGERIVRLGAHPSHRFYFEFPGEGIIHNTMPRGMKRSDRIIVHQVTSKVLDMRTERYVLQGAFSSLRRFMLFDCEGHETLDLCPGIPKITDGVGQTKGCELQTEIGGQGLAYKVHILAVMQEDSLGGAKPPEIWIDLLRQPPRPLLEAAAASRVIPDEPDDATREHDADDAVF